MQKRRGKRAQFFLVAAIIIAVILLGLASVYVSVRVQEEDNTLFDLSEEFSEEAAQVIDSGVINTATPESINAELQNLSDIYLKSNPDVEFTTLYTIVYGDYNQVFALEAYNEDLGNIGVGFGGNPSTLPISQREVYLSEISGEDVVNVQVRIAEGVDPLDFNLKSGQNFYIVIQKESGGDRIVAKT